MLVDINIETLDVGNIVRMNSDVDEAFADSVVIKIEDILVYLSRPYLYVSSPNTTCPSPLQGFESLTVNLVTLKERFKLVVDKKGRPHKYIT